MSTRLGQNMSTATKVGAHTPGPWVPKGGANDANCIADAAGHAVATAYYRDPSWAKDGETEANARLIAAAPDLLEALVVMERYHHENECAMDDDTAECLMMRAAIAKAEGR